MENNKNNFEQISNKDSVGYYFLILLLFLAVLTIILTILLIFDSGLSWRSSIDLISKVIILFYLGKNFSSSKSKHQLNILRKKNQL